MYFFILFICLGSDNFIYLYENFYLSVLNLVYIYKIGIYMKYWVLWLILKVVIIRNWK